jgi:hypothetical protein
MWDIPRLYVSACSNSCQLVPLHPIIISILFHHYIELKECISEVEQIQEASRITNNGSKKKERWLTEEEEEVPTTVTLDGYFIHNNANFK